MTVRQTSCRFCNLDIENFSPYRKGQWRDRGNNTTCPVSNATSITGDGLNITFHEPELVTHGTDYPLLAHEIGEPCDVCATLHPEQLATNRIGELLDIATWDISTNRRADAKIKIIKLHTNLRRENEVLQERITKLSELLEQARAALKENEK